MPKKLRQRRKQRQRRRGVGQSVSGLPSNTAFVERKQTSGLITTPKKAIGGFPEYLRTTLRYVEQITLTSTSGVATQYNFSGNSVFDPNYTGTGAQPANYDDFTAHYNRYRGLGSRITLIVVPSAFTAAGMVEVCLYPTNSVDSLNSNGSLAQPYAVFGISSPANQLVLQHSATGKSMLGQDPRLADRLQATYNADPSEEWLWNITAQSADASSTSSVLVKVVIDYDVEFFDRISGDLDFRARRLAELAELMKSMRNVKRQRTSKPLVVRGMPEWEASRSNGGQREDGKHQPDTYGKPAESDWELTPVQPSSMRAAPLVQGRDSSGPLHAKSTLSGPARPPSLRTS